MKEYFVIFGERLSRTSLLSSFLNTNLNIIEIKNFFGFKHFFGFKNLYNTENVLFISIVRNPYEWINSFFQEPHHIPDKNKCDINSFLFNEFYSVYSNNEIILEDLNYVTNEKYKNIFEMRFMKIKYLLNILPLTVKNSLFLKYEDFVKSPEEILKTIKTKFNIQLLCNGINMKCFDYFKGDLKDKIKYEKKKLYFNG